MGSFRPNKAKEFSQGEGIKVVHHTFNTITGGSAGGGEISSARRRHAHQMLNIEDLPDVEGKGKAHEHEATISFFEKDATVIHPHNDDPMVIIIRYDE